jgi:hypothetical protein
MKKILFSLVFGLYALGNAAMQGFETGNTKDFSFKCPYCKRWVLHPYHECKNKSD